MHGPGPSARPIASVNVQRSAASLTLLTIECWSLSASTIMAIDMFGENQHISFLSNATSRQTDLCID